ncbi:MAG: type IV secretory system conjugative DNA transfer family protein [Planctomycetota bacterium]
MAAARFERPEDIAATSSLAFNAAGNPEGKLFLGVIDGAVRSGALLPDGRPHRWVEGGTPIGVADDRHACTIAGSRAGKGRSALVTNLLTYPPTGGVLSIDPKGDNARLTARWRAEVLGQATGVIDPFDVSGAETQPYRTGFNPLRMLTDGPRDLLVPNANLIADALVVSAESKDPHWDNCARAMIGSGLCLHVATHPNYEGRRDLVTVWELAADLMVLADGSEKTCRVEQEMIANDAAGGAVRAAARAFYDRRGGEFSSVMSTLRKNLDWVSYDQMRTVLRDDVSVDLRDLKRRPMALYVSLPAMRMHDLSGWFRLLVQLALAACESEPKRGHVPVLLMLDEFHVLGRMTAIETAIAQIAGFSVKLWIVLQDIGQLKQYQNYETFLGNTGVLQCFGNGDFATLEYISKQLGQAQVLNPSVAATSYDQAVQKGVSGQSWSLGTHPLLTPEEIGRFFGRDDRRLRQLILRPGFRPMVLQRAFYDRHELFRNFNRES